MPLQDCFISSSASVGDAIERMNKIGCPAVAIVGNNDELLGLFTKGDMRKYFLSSGNLAAPIQNAMNASPIAFTSEGDIARARRESPLIVYPLVDDNNKLLKLLFNDRNIVPGSYSLAEVPLAIMAGGKGTRLYPYTKILPKALVPVGDKTISERIIELFHRYGCNDVWFILNEKGPMIEAYFASTNHSYDVHYVNESEFLGTAGGLSLLKGKIRSTFILSNCDILIDDDLSCAYATHLAKGNDITYVCAMATMEIPYGVISTDEDGTVVGMEEKPKYSNLVSTGVYVLEPRVLDYIEDGVRLDFPDLAKKCIEHGGKVGVFPVPEDSWIDMGEISKLQHARELFAE